MNDSFIQNSEFGKNHFECRYFFKLSSLKKMFNLFEQKRVLILIIENEMKTLLYNGFYLKQFVNVFFLILHLTIKIRSNICVGRFKTKNADIDIGIIVNSKMYYMFILKFFQFYL